METMFIMCGWYYFFQSITSSGIKRYKTISIHSCFSKLVMCIGHVFIFFSFCHFLFSKLSKVKLLESIPEDRATNSWPSLFSVRKKGLILSSMTTCCPRRAQHMRNRELPVIFVLFRRCLASFARLSFALNFGLQSCNFTF